MLLIGCGSEDIDFLLIVALCWSGASSTTSYSSFSTVVDVGSLVRCGSFCMLGLEACDGDDDGDDDLADGIANGDVVGMGECRVK